MIIVDCLGQPCPIPVVKAKKALAELPSEGGIVRVLVDNRVATENLSKMAKGMGLEWQVFEDAEDRFAVEIESGAAAKSEVGEKAVQQSMFPPAQGGAVVAIGQNAMGHGSEELGKILIKGFIFSLTQLETAPKTVLFFNSGVKLAMQGSNTVDDLKELESKGVKIYVCGTCANYFDLTDRLAVGEIVNMMTIAAEMAGANPLINI